MHLQLSIVFGLLKWHKIALKWHESALKWHKIALKWHASALKWHESALKWHEPALKWHESALKWHASALKWHLATPPPPVRTVCRDLRLARVHLDPNRGYLIGRVRCDELWGV